MKTNEIERLEMTKEICAAVLSCLFSLAGIAGMTYLAMTCIH